MTEEYTPTTEDVRVRYALDRGEAIRRPYSTSLADFDRWLNQVKAEAWDEAREAFIRRGTPGLHDNKYRKER